MNQPVFHTVDEPGGIRRLSESEVPTEFYNETRLKDLSTRHPNLSPGVLEHLGALEPFLDTSIVAGFSYGVEKGNIMVTEGTLLGHRVSREGASHDPDKTKAIDDFAPLKDVQQIRQFVGSTNWVRRYLFPATLQPLKF